MLIASLFTITIPAALENYHGTSTLLCDKVFCSGDQSFPGDV